MSFLPAEQVSESGERRRYQLPTHLREPDRFTFPLLGFTLSVTPRQGIILLLGGYYAFQLWKLLIPLSATAPGGPLLSYGIVVLFILLALVLAFVQVGGRPLEQWSVIWLRYHLRPRLYTWGPATLPSPSRHPLTSGRRRNR